MYTYMIYILLLFFSRFPSFTCGLKGLVIFNALTATLSKAKRQEANSSGEASVMRFSAVR